MSIQDIVNYVKKTPGNTNPSVIKSMVKSEVGEYVEEASNEAIRKLEENGRIGKEAQSYKEIIPEGSYEFRYGGYTAAVDSHPFREGDTVTLVLDGVTHTDTARHQHMEHPEDPSFALDYFYIGNPMVLGFEDNGKPYTVLCLSAEDDGVVLHGVEVLVMSEYTQTVFVNHTVSVYKPETIQPMNPKYLPGGSIRLDAYKDSYGTNLSNVVLNLAMQGGGVKTYDSGYEKLWEDILRIQPTYMIFTTGCDATLAIGILSADRAADASQWFASGTGVFVMGGLALTITAVLSATEDGKGVTISVLAEPITFPEVTAPQNEGEQS